MDKPAYDWTANATHGQHNNRLGSQTPGVCPPWPGARFSSMYAFPGSKPKTILGILGYPGIVLVLNPYGYWAKDRSGYFMIFFPEKS